MTALSKFKSASVPSQILHLLAHVSEISKFMTQMFSDLVPDIDLFQQHSWHDQRPVLSSTIGPYSDIPLAMLPELRGLLVLNLGPIKEKTEKTLIAQVSTAQSRCGVGAQTAASDSVSKGKLTYNLAKTLKTSVIGPKGDKRTVSVIDIPFKRKATTAFTKICHTCLQA